MRTLAFVVVASVPVLLIAAVVWQARHPPPPEKMPAAAGRDADAKLLALFDGPLAGAAVKAPPTLYDSKGLFNYIDGAAPVFIERHFRKLAAAEMSYEGSDLVCDIYDMSSPANAASIFEKERSASARPVDGWPEAIAGSMSFVFHAAPYYVKLTAFDAKAEAELPRLARTLREKIR